MKASRVSTTVTDVKSGEWSGEEVAHALAQAQQARTPLGRRLWEIRARVVASGVPMLSWEEIEREVEERRGGSRELFGADPGHMAPSPDGPFRAERAGGPRLHGSRAADCPGPNGWRSGGGVDGAEISVNATAQPCRRAISRRPETPFRTYACLAQRELTCASK